MEEGVQDAVEARPRIVLTRQPHRSGGGENQEPPWSGCLAAGVALKYAETPAG